MAFLQASTAEFRQVYWLAVAIVGAFVGWKVLRYGMRPKNMPPGPPTIPILGNLHQMPLKDFHFKFREWAQEYGPIVTLKVGGSNIILLNDESVVKDLLEKRGHLYAARPDLFIREFCGNMNIAFRDNDDVWRRQRKMYHLRLNKTVANQYVPYQAFDSTQLLNDMLDTPDDFSRHIQRYTTSVASTVLYGWRTTSGGQKEIKDLMDWMDLTEAASSLQLVDFFPFLRPIYRYCPTFLMPYKQTLRKIRKIEDRLFFQLMNSAKENIAKGKVYPSFIRDMLLSEDKDRLNEVEIANNAAHGFGAATDTQWNTTLGFVKAMLLYPEVQAEAHRELDRVIGKDRLPQWDDRENLPYMRAIVEESLRWMPTTLSAAVPHSLLKDDVYKGYLIPKGSSMFINVWTLNNNVKNNPRAFDPSRHSPEDTLNDNYGIDPDSSKRPHFTFGAGRRVCPGFHVAERGLFIAMSRLLWAFKFDRKLDASGAPIPIVQDAVTDGFIVRPVTYPAVIKPRDQGRVKVIRDAWKEAQDSLDASGNFTEEFFEKVFVSKMKKP
ncbi:cytochrome P450 [Lepidopterella palustris CBS 459.81]|uniref:Cytochrome P450 n=1 Tax=Lepidopterella palustris CBS 459.81 TaxID=1314670 RepID=A0A8E2E1E8_9PEZI|nr:cytochrome P450 [Lepidopterella palustris CBS 459.81]